MLILLLIAICIGIIAGCWHMGHLLAERHRDRRRRREIADLERLYRTRDDS